MLAMRMPFPYRPYSFRYSVSDFPGPSLPPTRAVVVEIVGMYRMSILNQPTQLGVFDHSTHRGLRTRALFPFHLPPISLQSPPVFLHLPFLSSMTQITRHFDASFVVSPGRCDNPDVYAKSGKAHLDDNCILTAFSIPKSSSFPSSFSLISLNAYSLILLAFHIDIPGPSQPPVEACC